MQTGKLKCFQSSRKSSSSVPAGGAKSVCTRASLECSSRATTVSLRGSLFLSNQPVILYGTWGKHYNYVLVKQLGVPTRFDTKRSVQSQKMVRGLKFWIWKVEELYYPCSENKGADQLRSYCEADLRLCFRICRLLVFPCGGSYVLL